MLRLGWGFGNIYIQQAEAEIVPSSSLVKVRLDHVKEKKSKKPLKPADFQRFSSTGRKNENFEKVFYQT